VFLKATLQKCGQNKQNTYGENKENKQNIDLRSKAVAPKSEENHQNKHSQRKY